MDMRGKIRCHSLPFLLLVVLLWLQPAVAHACSLDGIASITANGNTANLTGGAPTAATIAYWAQFTLPAAAPEDALQLAEDLGKLRRTLPAAAFAKPFRWAFGDGTEILGLTGQHRYQQLGWHKITVSYYWASGNRWVVFDNAQIHIVPPGDVWRANLGYTIGKIFQIIVRITIWLTALFLIGLAIWVRIRSKRGSPRNALPTQSTIVGIGQGERASLP